jgi:succinate-acetate transporter protein
VEQVKKLEIGYTECGVIMIIAMAVIFLGGFCKLIPEDFYQNHQLTFWMEALAVESFGFSWLIKGETLFKDKNNNSYQTINTQ